MNKKNVLGLIGLLSPSVVNAEGSLNPDVIVARDQAVIQQGIDAQNARKVINAGVVTRGASRAIDNLPDAEESIVVVPSYVLPAEASWTDFFNKAKELNYGVMQVPLRNGSPSYVLWDVSEAVRGKDYVLSNGVDPRWNVTMCDSENVRREIVGINNRIADASAEVANLVGMNSYAQALLSDYQAVVAEKVCFNVEVVRQRDGVKGDGFRNVKSRVPSVDYVLVAIKPEDMPVRECPAPEPVPAVPEPVVPEEPVAAIPEPVVPTEPVVPRAKEPIVYGNGLIGYRILSENGEAPLFGHGPWIEGKVFGTVGENGSLVLDVDRETAFSSLRYDDGSGNVRVLDTDISGSYAWTLSSARVALGLNFDGRVAAVEYAGVNANTGNVAVGPEVALLVNGDRFNADTSATLGFGSLRTNVDVPGYEPTKDQLIKAKLDLSGQYGVFNNWLGLGLVGRLESNMNGKTAADNSGVVPSNDSLFTFGPFVRLGDKVKGIVGLDYLMFRDPIADYSTNAASVYGGIGGSF